MPYCNKCGQFNAEDAIFCSACGFTLSIKADSSRTIYHGVVHKCPNCGETITSFVANCPTCGFEFRDSGASTSIQHFSNELSKAYSTQQKASIIRSFPIPNSKEDIFEFMLLASSNLKGEQERQVFDAWTVKFEQSYQKAQLVIKNADDIQIIKNTYEKTNKQIQKQIRKYNQSMRSQSNVPSLSFVLSGLAALIGRSLAYIAGFLLYFQAIKIDQNGGNSTGHEFLGGILLIVSSLALFRRKSSVFDFIIGAAAGVLSIYMARFLDNGSGLELFGAVVILNVAVAYFKRLFGKKEN